MIDKDLEKALNQIVNLLTSMEKRLNSIESKLKKEYKEKVLHG